MLCGAWAACSESEESSQEEESELPDEVSVLVGKSGGHVRAKGASLDIPAGALDKDVMLSVKNIGKSKVGVKTKAVSDVFEFGPKGTKFLKDIEVSFETKQPESKAQVYFTKEADPESFEKLASVVQGQNVSAKVRHFSQGFAGIPEDDDLLDAAVDAPIDAAVDEPLDAGADATTGEEQPQNTRITLRSQDSAGKAVNHTWVAFQDGEGAWQALQPSTLGRYEFQVSAPRFGLVAVCADSGSSLAKFIFAPAASTEQTLEVMGYCQADSLTVGYTISGALPTSMAPAFYEYGHGVQTGTAELPVGAPNTYAIPGMLAGVELDPVLILRDASSSARGHIMRNLALDADLPNHDLDANLWYALVDRAVSVTANGGALAISMTAELTTRGAKKGVNLVGDFSGVPGKFTFGVLSFPQAALIATDRYRFVAKANVGTNHRELEVLTTSDGDFALTMPSVFSPTFETETTGPTLRPSVRFARDAGAKEYGFNYQYIAGQNPRLFEARIEAGYFSTAEAEHAFTYPDLEGTAGFQSAWLVPSGAAVSMNASVTKTGTVTGGTFISRSETSAAPVN